MRMRKAAVIVMALAFAGVSIAQTDRPEPLTRNEAPVLDVRVTVRPVADDEYLLLPRPKPNSFRCRVLVLEEPGSNRAWATDDIVVAAGQSGEATSSLGDLSLHFAARITERGEAAETVVTVTRNGRILNRQRTTVALAAGIVGLK